MRRRKAAARYCAKTVAAAAPETSRKRGPNMRRGSRMRFTPAARREAFSVVRVSPKPAPTSKRGAKRRAMDLTCHS